MIEPRDRSNDCPMCKKLAKQPFIMYRAKKHDESFERFYVYRSKFCNECGRRLSIGK